MIRTLSLVAVAVAGTIVVAAAQQQQTPPPPPPPTPDSTATTTPAGSVVIMREIFSYGARGRRDPMVSLMNSDDLRPLIQDLQLLGLIYDATGRGSQATLKDLTDETKLYRVRIGQVLGRMTVTEITARDIEFTIDEFGFSRRERLPLKPDTTDTRTP